MLPALSSNRCKTLPLWTAGWLPLPFPGQDFAEASPHISSLQS